jgi:hypothetical protein
MASGFSMTTGAQNTFVGAYSGYAATTGCRNTLVGYNTGASTGFCGSIVLGWGAQATGNCQLVLGSAAQALGTASDGTFNQYLCVVVNGTNFRIPLYTA